ncbi:hypothetical protein Q1695_015703 [Nippostrongylus brasiliensis]|nr:hypothetical protein Q1695_015703 [Nippostrongylus brasiliensis]
MLFQINRFHLFVLITWQFAIFFASQQIFPIFSNYVPEWQCGEDGPITKNCSLYTSCNDTLTYPRSQFHSAALEFGWICGSTAYLASLFSQIQFVGVLCGTISFGALSDIFGRKPVAIFTFSMGIFTNFITGG